MTNLEIIHESFQGLLAQACLSALFAIVGVAVAAKVLKKFRFAFSCLWQKSRVSFAAVALLSVAMALWADKTNLLRMIIHPGMPPVVTVSSEDILRGFRLDGIVTNDEPLCDMPIDAVEYPPWRLRAGRETDFPLNLGDFVFPYGTNTINRFRVLSGGTIETLPKLNAPVSICAARKFASLSPGVSRFWSADANGGAEKVLRWDSVFANDDRTGEYSAEIRLSANGDFSTKSNALETVYRRVNPHDWDGDGLANEIDANPTTSDGDYFGTGVDWLNVNCAGVLSAATNGQGEVEITWHTNANPNAYYWLDLTATGALGVAKITATCDGESNLGDLAVVARTNEVCRVPLLVGATYTVESDLPISYSAVSSEHASIFTNSEHSLVVSFPLEFSLERVQTRSGGGPVNYAVSSSPINVFPNVAAVDGGCCTITCCETCFSWECLPSCRCVGADHSISVCVGWGGYSRWIPFTAGCNCSHEADHDINGAAVRIAFAEGAIVFENAYTNAPDDVMTRRSTSTTLSCRVSGGQFGGNVSVELVDGGRLLRTSGFAVPCSESVSAGEVVLLTSEYEAISESAAADDIVATAVFTENMTGRQLTNTTTLTSVRVNVSAAADFPTNKIRHVFGPQEVASFAATPVIDGAFWTAGETNVFGSPYNYSAPIVPTNDVVKFSIGSVNFNMNVNVIPPTRLKAVECRIASTNEWFTRTGDYPHPGDMAVGMITELKLLPDYVSFRHLFLQEGECQATSIWGLFAPYASGLLPHDEIAGAWEEVAVSATNNNAGVDFAATNFGEVPSTITIAPGGFEYVITNYWYVKNNGEVTGQKHPFATNPVIFSTSVNGSMTVNRFNCTVTRGTNDVSTIIRSP